MRGQQERSGSLFSDVSIEEPIPARHPLRRIRQLVDQARDRLNPTFWELDASEACLSVPPEQLLLASLLQAFYGIRSERLLLEQVMGQFLEKLMASPEGRPLLSNEHFSVDGTLLQAWASHASLERIDGEDDPPPPPSGPGEGFGEARTGQKPANGDFRGSRLSTKTHRSSTDPDALLAHKSNVHPALPSYQRHVFRDHRHALVVDCRVRQAEGYGERDAANAMAADRPGAHRTTIGADKNDDSRGFVPGMRRLGVTPHGAQNSGRSGGSRIDRGTTCHKSYAQSIHARQRNGVGLDQAVRRPTPVQAARSGQYSCRIRSAWDRLQPDPAGEPASTPGGDGMNRTFFRTRSQQGDTASAMGTMLMVSATQKA